MPVKTPPTEPRPWELLLRQVSLVQEVLLAAEPALGELGLETKGFFVLAMLDAYPNPASLARALATPKPTITFLVKRLEGQGYVRRDSEPGDLRRFRLTLTLAGRRALEKGKQAVDSIYGQRLAAMPRESRQALVRAVMAATDAGGEG